MRSAVRIQPFSVPLCGRIAEYVAALLLIGEANSAISRIARLTGVPTP
jgi:hypothetical protein